MTAQVREVMLDVETFCDSVGFINAGGVARLSGRHYLTVRRDRTVLMAELRHMESALILDAAQRRYLLLNAADAEKLLDNDELFGPEVAEAFPSTSRDLREAGNALAAGNGTACVFHLMRAAEIVLRVLALDRGVTYPDASVSSKQIGDLLAALDGKLAELRKTDGKRWPSREVKDAQLRFYHSAVAEFRDFNEAWRKHMAHAHEGSFYDSDMARSIMKHVQTLTQTLAAKISEGSTTPEYWTE